MEAGTTRARSSRQSNPKRPKGRACKPCHAAKVKCSGSQPCERCTRRKDTCVFTDGDARITVERSYLRDLQRRAQDHSSLTSSAACTTRNASSSATGGLQPQPRAIVADPARQSSPQHPRTFSYVRDARGRQRFLGPTSTWSYTRKALALIQEYAPQAGSPPDPINLDGTAFRIKWRSKVDIDQFDLVNLPPKEYARYLMSTVIFRFGELAQLIDEENFLHHLDAFYQDPLPTAQNQHLWFVKYLLVVAFGKAFLSQAGPVSVPAGCEYGTLALSLLPDPAHMHEEQMLSIEVLALAAIYTQAIDVRMVAFQYIGQALRLCFVAGIYRDFADDVYGPELSNRYNMLWWTVYVLDREISALTGAPNTISEDEITAPLPSDRQSTLSATALTLRVRLSRIVAQICTTVHGVGEKPGDMFVRKTTSTLHSLAVVSRELDEAVSKEYNTAIGGLTPAFTSAMLSYHHCIVLATRPLVMWFLTLYLTAVDTHPPQLSEPSVMLLLKSAESATTILRILESLSKHDLLETFLPFHLEYAFSSALLLSLLNAVYPEYVSDKAWAGMSHALLDTLIKKGNVVAQLRKNEMEQLEQLLSPVCRPSGLTSGRSAAPASLASNPQAQNATTNYDTSSTIGTGYLEFQAPGTSWDALYDSVPIGANHDQFLSLAEQFNIGDLDSAFLFDP